MAAITPQRPGLTGVTPVYTGCGAGGDTVPTNDGRVTLHFKNGSGGSLTVKVDDPSTVVPNATSLDPDVTITIAAGAERKVGPFDPARFGTTLNLAYPGGVTSLSVNPIGV